MVSELSWNNSRLQTIIQNSSKVLLILKTRVNGHILVFHPYTTKLEPHCTAQIPLADQIPRSLLLHASRLVYKSERTEKKTKKQRNRVPRLVKYLFYLWVHIRRGRFKFKQTFGFSRLYIEIWSRTQSY